LPEEAETVGVRVARRVPFVSEYHPQINVSSPRQTVGAVGRKELVAVVALTALAAALRLVMLGSQALWYDEVWTLDLAHSSLGLMLRRIPNWETTPPLYYLFAWASNHAFGPSQAALRLPGALAGVLTVPAVWGAARRFGGVRAGVIAAAFTACSPFMWWYSQEARAYSMAALFCALSLWFLARALDTGAWRDFSGWAIACSLAALSQYPAGLVFGMSAVAALIAAPRFWRRVVVVSLLPVATGLAIAPLAAEQRSTGRSDWIELFPLRGRLEQIVAQFWFGNPVFSSGRSLSVAALVGALAVVAIAILGSRRPQPVGRGPMIPAFVAIGTVAMFGFSKVVGTDTILARNLIVIWPTATTAVAIWLARIGRRSSIVFTASVCLVMVALIIRVDSVPRLQRGDWRPAASLLMGSPPAGGRVILLQGYPHSRPITAYLPGLRRPTRKGDSVTELSVISLEMPPPRWCWWGGVCTDGILRGYSSRPMRSQRFAGFTRVSTSRAGAFTLVTLRSQKPISLTTRSVLDLLPPRLRGAVLYQR